MNSPTSTTDYTFPSHTSLPTIPSQLKFLISNIKNLLPIQLTTDNHITWKAQVLKIFSANRFDGYLNGSLPYPSRHLLQIDGTLLPNPSYQNWQLIDQNLTATLYSTISPPLLPYILTVTTCHDIWTTLKNNFNPQIILGYCSLKINFTIFAWTTTPWPNILLSLNPKLIPLQQLTLL